MTWVTPAVSLAGALIAGTCALLAWSLNRRGQRGQAHLEINDRYDRLMAFRVNHPEVLALSRRWSAGNFSRMYRQDNEEDRQWAIYYSYVELVLGFCNAVAYARERRLLDPGAYEAHYRPLMKLLLTVHQPLVSALLPGPYVSAYIRDFWRTEEAAGWDWRAEHNALHMGQPPE